MKKVFLCFLDAFEGFGEINQKIKEKLLSEYVDFDITEIYTMKISLEKIKAGDTPDILVIIDLPGISGAKLLIEQIFKNVDIVPEIKVICNDEETIKQVHNLGIENVKKVTDVLEVRQRELEIF